MNGGQQEEITTAIHTAPTPPQQNRMKDFPACTVTVYMYTSFVMFVSYSACFGAKYASGINVTLEPCQTVLANLGPRSLQG
jgi:hypothetical protein